MPAVGITRLGLAGVSRVNKTAPKIIQATGFAVAVAEGAAILFGSGIASAAGLGTGAAIGVGTSASAVGSAVGTSTVLGRTRQQITRLGLTGAPRVAAQRTFNITSRSWSVSLQANMSGLIGNIDQFFIAVGMQANIATNMVAAPLVAARAQGTSTAVATPGTVAVAAGASTVTGVGQLLTSLFGVGTGSSVGASAVSAVAPSTGVGNAAGVGQANGAFLGLGTIPSVGSAPGLSVALAIGSTVSPNFAPAAAQSVGVGWAYAVAPIDNTPPGAPGLIIASNITASSVQLDWPAVTDVGGAGLAGYLITRNGTLITPIAISDLTFIDMGLQGGQTYTYLVSAIDNAGNPSVGNPSVAVVTATGSGVVTTVVIRRKDSGRI
mgnify:CR=1 FL=1